MSILGLLVCRNGNELAPKSVFTQLGDAGALRRTSIVSNLWQLRVGHLSLGALTKIQ
jgi:hypothetical protein